MKFKIGDIVYFEDTWAGSICMGVVSWCSVSDQMYLVDKKNFVDRHGNNIGECFKHNSLKFKEGLLFSTIDEAFAASVKRIEDYCEEIKTNNDLLRFPLEHCLFGCEYINFEAVKAYKIRCKDLTGIDLGIEEDEVDYE